MNKKSPANPYTLMALEAAHSYERLRHLPSLLALWPRELNDFGSNATKEILDKLQSALGTERRRSRAGHWSYDLNRHLALISALEGERQHLASCRPNAKCSNANEGDKNRNIPISKR